MMDVIGWHLWGLLVGGVEFWIWNSFTEHRESNEQLLGITPANQELLGDTTDSCSGITRL